MYWSNGGCTLPSDGLLSLESLDTKSDDPVSGAAVAMPMVQKAALGQYLMARMRAFRGTKRPFIKSSIVAPLCYSFLLGPTSVAEGVENAFECTISNN